MLDSHNHIEGTTPKRSISADDFRRLHPKLYAQIRRLGIPPGEIDDLVQETFLHAQQALDGGKFEGRSSLDTWIVSIAKKNSLKYHRRRQALKRSAAVVSIHNHGEGEGSRNPKGLASSGPDPHVHAAQRQLLRRTLQAIQDLPERFRGPLVLSVRGLTYDQIAIILQIPVSRVTSRIHQARTKLRMAHSESEPRP